MESPVAQPEQKFRELIDIITRLRSPNGCPWDRSQEKGDVGRYLIEEAYEVIEALDSGSPAGLKEELGDLLFQILFLANLAEGVGEFDIAGVLSTATEKMIRRHPHVFADAKVTGVEEVRENWERIKRDVEHKGETASCLTSGIPRSLSTLARTQRITTSASRLGFDWNSTAEVLAKLEEETAEFRAALQAGNRKDMQEEAGDLLFTVVNLCRFVPVDAEAALRGTLRKFIERFAYIEKSLADQGKTPDTTAPAEMDRLWNEAKGKGFTEKR